jgi:sugar (pentulose or hexulose) kinase
VPDLPDATGALLGIRPGKLDSAVIYRAALEGVSLNLAWGIDRMRALGIRVESVRLVGGGARNALWRQILADVIGVPVQALAESESAALGAALQGLWVSRGAHGESASIDALGHEFSRLSGEPADPVPQNRNTYRVVGGRFRASAGGDRQAT